MKHKILVTGGAGYLGSVLVARLVAQGHHVTVVDNFMYQQNSLSQLCLNDNFEIERGDVRNMKLMKGLVRDKDIIIPLAALVGAPLCDADPEGSFAINQKAAIDLFNICAKDQVILMPTTNSAYGHGDEKHFCNEDSPLHPISFYAQQKVAVESALRERGNFISYRLATVFGMSPRMRLDLLVNDMTYRAVNDGSVVLFEGHFKRNYLHIQDVARAFVYAIDNYESLKNQVFNVGLSAANLSKVELCQKIKEYVPNFEILEAPIAKDPDQRNYIVSNDKLEKTGFHAEISIDRGIRELRKAFVMIKNQKFCNVR